MPRAPRFLLLLVLALAASGARAASFPPGLRFQTLSTPRVSVHFHQGLEAMAREAAALSTELLEAHEVRYGHRVGRVHVVLADVDDDPNGFATPLPYALVNLRAAAPDGTDEFGNHDGWLRLVLAHELAHVVHLERARGLFAAGRKLFGRAPFLFPNVLSPTWLIEGLATYEETEATSLGRGRSPDARMVLRMAALDGRFPREDQAVFGLDAWPAGLTPYLFGEAFLRHVSERAGEQVLPELARVHAGRVVPYLDDLTSHRVTGSTFHAHWAAWTAEVRAEAEREARARQQRSLTASRALTREGVRQTAPRFSPDGAWIAYSSRGLTRFPSIRLVRADGRDDRRLAERNGVGSLSWTPDGKSLVYAEAERHELFATYRDLRAVDVETGRVRRLSRGLRASDPDVSPDGARLVFARRMGDRAELFEMGLDGAGLRQVTRSEAGTHWSGPRWSPDGGRIAAARLRPGGWLDVVLVDPASGAAEALTADRAKDVEPTWTPRGEAVVFRSDRDGVSNLYAVRVADRVLLRLTNVLGGAFAPSVSPDGRELAFAAYGAGGYDVHVAALDLDAAVPAEPFVDPYPPPSLPPEPVAAEQHPYRPEQALWPRFWTPYVLSGEQEWRLGAASASFDPLFRHFWALDVSQGTESDRLGARAVYQYDRFRPTLLAAAQDTTELESEGSIRKRAFQIRSTLPLRRTLRSTQALSLTWRRQRETLEAALGTARVDLGGVEVAWALSSARQYPYSISPVDGGRLRLAYVKEDPAFGGQVSLGKFTADGRLYARLFGEADVLAVRAGGGTTLGGRAFTRSFAVGGFPRSDLFDLEHTNLALLRGYPRSAFAGRSFAQANVEYRVPLASLQRGWRSVPLFVRHLHAAVYFDSAHAWTGPFRLGDVKTSGGIALGTDVYLGHRVPITVSAGLARGFAELGKTSAYLRLGTSF